MNVLLKHTGFLKCYFRQDTNDDRRDLTLFEYAIHQTANLTSDTDEVKVLLKQNLFWWNRELALKGKFKCYLNP